jgi:hypothetical protein
LGAITPIPKKYVLEQRLLQIAIRNSPQEIWNHEIKRKQAAHTTPEQNGRSIWKA